MKLKTIEEREAYRVACNYYMEGSEQCAKASGYYGKVHVTAKCDGKCERMKRYDKRYIVIKDGERKF